MGHNKFKLRSFINGVDQVDEYVMKKYLLLEIALDQKNDQNTKYNQI